MADDPNGDDDAEKAKATGSTLANLVETEETPVLGADQEGDSTGPQDGRHKGKRNPFNVLRHLTVNERLTLLVGVGTLVVSILAAISAADNRDTRDAIRNLSELASQTKRQADASSAQVALLNDQLQALRRQAGSTDSLASAAGRSADAAADQVREMRDEKRPWITVGEPVLVPQTPTDERWGQRWLAIPLSASGQRPAFKVTVLARLLAHSAEVRSAQAELCVRTNPKIQYDNAALFPGQRRLENVANVTANALNTLSVNGIFRGAIAGCVVYADEGGNLHRTTFAYDIRQTNGPDGPDIPGGVQVEGVKSEPLMVFVPNAGGITRAD